jgi:predicted AlkP superfamily phosphohydrolase/phosphomutase
MRVRVLGLDGMGLETFLELGERGLLPNAARIAEQFQIAPLRSTTPSYTVPGWASAFTGVPPGEHGLLWWRRGGPPLPWADAVDGGFASISEARRPPVWLLLRGTGASVAVIDVPATFPAVAVDGILVAGFLAPWPHRAAVWPASAYEQISSWPSQEGLADHQHRDPTAYVHSLTEAAAVRLAAFRTWCHSTELDVLIFVLVGPDRINHLSWGSLVPSGQDPLSAAVASYWAVVDRYLGVLLDAVEAGAAAIVCSDHGSGPPARAAVNTRPFLISRGYWRREGIGRMLPLAAWRRLRWLRDRARPALGWLRRTPAPFGAVPWSELADALMGDREAGFFLGPGAGREGLLAQLGVDLRDLRLDGRPVFDRVCRAEEAIGPVAEGVLAPDLIALTAEDFAVGQGSLFDPVCETLRGNRRGRHTALGMVALAPGPAAGLPAEPRIEDIAPTILSLLGFAPPRWMLGRSLAPVTADQALGDGTPAVPVGIGDADPAWERQMEQHLRALGYLE